MSKSQEKDFTQICTNCELVYYIYENQSETMLLSLISSVEPISGISPVITDHALLAWKLVNENVALNVIKPNVLNNIEFETDLAPTVGIIEKVPNGHAMVIKIFQCIFYKHRWLIFQLTNSNETWKNAFRIYNNWTLPTWTYRCQQSQSRIQGEMIVTWNFLSSCIGVIPLV